MEIREDFVALMPKVELHAHLNGCIREATLRELAEERNVKLNSRHFGENLGSDNNSNDLSMYNVTPRSLKDCFDMFADIPLCVDDMQALKRITWEALEDFSNHHVVYLELRSTPKRLKNVTKRGYIETILSVMEKFEDQEQQRYRSQISQRKDSRKMTMTATDYVRLPMICRFLVSIDRSASKEEADEHVDLAIKLNQINPRVVGMDIGGNPTKNCFRDFQPAVAKARDAGMKITLHCAEIPVGESITEEDSQLRKAFEEVNAIFDFRPDRLGHALLLPPSLRDILLYEVKIPVESCPTSNIMTLELARHVEGSLIHGLQQHPQLKFWLDMDFPISIGTDDPGVFNTNATKELLLLARAWDLSQDRLISVVVNSVDHSFCDALLKERIKTSMNNFLLAISTE